MTMQGYLATMNANVKC